MSGIRLRSWVASATALLTTSWMAQASAQNIYLESNGYVAIEAESAALVQGWVEHAPEVDNARGQALRFTEGASICSTPAGTAEGFPTLDYHVHISEAGTYRLKLNIFKQIHCVSEGSDGASYHNGAGCQSMGIQSDGDSCDGANECWRSDISNDAYVNVTTADGTGVPFVGGGTQIMKFFGGNGERYAWSGDSALDHKNPDYDLVPGDYIIKRRGRSRGFSFDRLIFYKDGADQNGAKAAPESPIAVDEPPLGTGGMTATGGTGGEDPTLPGTGGSGTGGTGDPTTPPAPSTGGTNPNGSDPTDPTGGDGDAPTGEDAEPSDGNGTSSDTSGCSVRPQKRSPAPLLWLMMIGLFAWGRLRRRTI